MIEHFPLAHKNPAQQFTSPCQTIPCNQKENPPVLSLSYKTLYTHRILGEYWENTRRILADAHWQPKGSVRFFV